MAARPAGLSAANPIIDAAKDRAYQSKGPSPLPGFRSVSGHSSALNKGGGAPRSDDRNPASGRQIGQPSFRRAWGL